MPLEQVSVDVGKPRQILVEGCGALVLRHVEHLEQLREPRPEIGPVLAGAGLDEIEEDVARLEHPSVVREHAEHHPHEEPFQIVPPVPRVRESIVQPPDQLEGRCSSSIAPVESPRNLSAAAPSKTYRGISKE